MCQMHTLGDEPQEVAPWKAVSQTAIDFCQGRWNLSASYYPQFTAYTQHSLKKKGDIGAKVS